MKFRDHELDTNFATTAFSESCADEAKRLSMAASSELNSNEERRSSPAAYMSDVDMANASFVPE